MPKIVGLLTGINYVEDWIEPAIQQALNICDEVIVSIGANNQQLEVLQDSTLEKARAFGDRIKMVAAVKGKTFAQGKAPTLNNMLKASSAEVGDWFWLLDADEFYFDETVEQVRAVVNSDNDLEIIKIQAKFFFINMTRYLHSQHNRLFRKTHEGAFFKPVQNWQSSPEYRGNRFCIQRDDHRLGMFHYSLLMDPRYRKLFWENEQSAGAAKMRDRNRTKVEWLEQTYNTFDLNDEESCLARNRLVLDTKRWDEMFPTPIWNWDFKPDKGGKLFRYDGPQPSVIEEAGLHLVEDFREFKKTKGSP